MKTLTEEKTVYEKYVKLTESKKSSSSCLFL